MSKLAGRRGRLLLLAHFRPAHTKRNHDAQTRKPGIALLGDVRLSLSTVGLDFLSPSAAHFIHEPPVASIMRLTVRPVDASEALSRAMSH
jgi:hypothetical protein